MALQDMCAYDLPYGSKAYLKATAVLNEIITEEQSIIKGNK